MHNIIQRHGALNKYLKCVINVFVDQKLIAYLSSGLLIILLHDMILHEQEMRSRDDSTSNCTEKCTKEVSKYVMKSKW